MAPFYYKLGDALATYVEMNVDEMNNLKPLNLQQDSEGEEAEDEQLENLSEQDSQIQTAIINSTKDQELIIQDADSNQIDSFKKNETKQGNIQS